MSPSAAYAMADTVPFAVPRTTLVWTQRVKGSRDANSTRTPWPTAVTSPSVARPAGASPTFCTSGGMPPGHDDEAGSVWRILMTRRRTSSMPSWSITHLRRARSLLSRLPVWSNTRRTASIVGSRSSRVVKSSSDSAGCGVAPSPPAMYTRKPCSTVPSSSVRVTATTPTSLNIAWPQSVEHPEKFTLNLRGRRCPSGLRTKCRKTASAHGVTSRRSCGHAPARWHAITLRTVSPHASREVRPTAASRRSRSGIRRSSTKWNCTFWRVVMWPHPREYSVAMSPIRSSCSGEIEPAGTLIRTIWFVPPWRWP
jgi:hypothetical protein